MVQVIPVLVRVHALDRDELAEVVKKASCGTEMDCWYLIDPSDFPDEVKGSVQKCCDFLGRKEGRRASEELLINEAPYHVRVWKLFDEAPDDDGVLKLIAERYM